MEMDETLPCANINSFLPLNRDVLSIETGVEKMTVNDTDMLDSSDIIGVPENPCSLISSKKPIYHTSAEAFLQFEKERQDRLFSRSCLFCRKHFTGNRSLLLEHFTEQHNFFIGQPDNLVFINEFLDMLEEMLNKLQCLYCKKIFKDWATLKEHMRKKMHKRINSSDINFDRFYMTNYLNAYDNMVTSPNAQCEVKIEHSNQFSDTLLAQDDEREIEMEPMDSCIICLYCDSKYFDFDEIMHHLKVVHNFDFKHLKEANRLSFYSQVKLINYIRRKVLVNECTICDVKCPSKESLVKHMTDSGHITLLPDRSKWDQSEFFFSTLDTDYLLCGLEDDDDDEDCSDDHAKNYMDYDSSVKVFCEDVVFPQSSILTDEELRKSLL